jgi:CRP-like cAMP-binding protein
MAKDTSKLRRKAAEQLQKGSRDRALALLKEACDKDQYDPDNWLQLATVQLQAGDTAAAAESMFRTTDIYARCGMVKEAFAACCQTLDLAPTHGPARRMGRFLVSRLPEAEQDAADAQLDQAGKRQPAASVPAAAAEREAAPAAPSAPAAAAPAAAEAAAAPAAAEAAAAPAAAEATAAPAAAEARAAAPSAAARAAAPSVAARAAAPSAAATAAAPSAAATAAAPSAAATAAAPSAPAVPTPAAAEAALASPRSARAETPAAPAAATAAASLAAAVPAAPPVSAAPASPAAAVGAVASVPAEPAAVVAADRGDATDRVAVAGSAPGQELGPEPGEDERTIERGAIRRVAEGEEEIEEKTIERGAVRQPLDETGTAEGAEAGDAEREVATDGLPEEAAESAATSPWWTGIKGPPPLAPPEGTPEAAEDDTTLPLWPPRVVLPPPPVEILTLEIEAELPDDGRPQLPVQGEFETPAAAAGGAAPSGEGGPERPTTPGPSLPEGGARAPIPPGGGPAELPSETPMPAEPALDALSLRDLLGTVEAAKAAKDAGDGPVEILVDPPVVEGTPGAQEPAGVAAALRSPLFGDLDPALLKRLVDGAELQRRRRGEVVMRQGTFGTALYVILRGEVAVVRENPPPQLTLAKLRTGAFFGEMSLITNFPRSATVVAESDLDLLVVPRKQVSELCAADPQVLRTLLRFCRGRMVATLMAVSPIFQPLGPEVRRGLLRHFRLREYVPGAEIVTEGQESGGLHIVMAGRLKVARRAAGETSTVLASLGPGDVFGEMSLLAKGPAMASITAETRVWVLVLPTVEFETAISRDHPELVAYLGAVADERRRQNQQAEGGTAAYRDGRIETP